MGGKTGGGEEIENPKWWGLLEGVGGSDERV